MKIELHQIPIKELVKDYVNSAEEGVKGYGGRLDIRPRYQREFVYNEQQRSAVMDTVRNGYPLNVMYWVKNGENSFEVLDGQQRSISICDFVSDYFSINSRYFRSLAQDEREKILNYELMVYFCEGEESEKLAWFKIVNIAGAVLTEQELRNAVYTGQWLSDAKGYFSKPGCTAYRIGNKFVNGTPIRQDYLETALKWISQTDPIYKGKIEEYMSNHQRDPDALQLWSYFQSVITWVEGKFPNYRREMKGIDWGGLYNQFKDKTLDPLEMEKEIKRLMMDDDVTRKSGIYPYLLARDEKYLNIRTFSESQKRAAYEKQNGVCPLCTEHFAINEMEGDHITPWSEGGHTAPDNIQMLCKNCNRRKGNG